MVIKYIIFILFITFSLMTAAIADEGKTRKRRGLFAGAGYALQTCPNGYYCPSDRECKGPRKDRCSSSQKCTNLDMCNNCSDGGYAVYIGHSTLFGKKKRYALEHQFVEYRGYVYEYGSSFNQVLDIADPQYKYVNGKDIIEDPTFKGCSYCRYEDAHRFTKSDKWKISNYRFWSNNCQDFAEALVEFLTTSSCNKQVTSSEPPLNEGSQNETENNSGNETENQDIDTGNQDNGDISNQDDSTGNQDDARNQDDNGSTSM